MTELELRNKYASTMLGWVGKKESDGSHRSIVDIYNTQKTLPAGYRMRYTDSWCACTISAAAIACKMESIFALECSCPRQIELWKKMNRWIENDAYIPRISDIIYYDWNDNGVGDNQGTADHVGAVVAVNGDTIKVVEGNYHDAVGIRYIKVNARYIRGYASPDFAKLSNGVSEVVAKKETNTPTTTNSTASLEVAKYFSKNVAKTYTVTASSLNIRTGAGTNKKILGTLPRGTRATCYGYYCKVGAEIWPLVVANGLTGYVSKKYLQ